MPGRRKKARVSVLQPNDKEKLSLLVELSFEPIIVWDLERGIVDWNPGLRAAVWLYARRSGRMRDPRLAADGAPGAAQRGPGATRCPG